MKQKEQIFTQLVADNRKAVYRICLAYLYDRSHADDLYQEILLQAWKSLDSFRGDASMNTWLYRIAVNTAITYNRKEARSRVNELPDHLQPPASHSEAQDREAQLNKLSLAISRLEEQDRLLISLVLEDMSYKQIAEITGTSVNNTGVRITRVKARLMKLMTKKNGDDGF